MTVELTQFAWESYRQGGIDAVDTLIETWEELAAALRAAGLPDDPRAILAATRGFLVARPLVAP